MSDTRNKLHVMLAIVICLVLFSFLQVLSLALYPPDFSFEYPLYSPSGILLLEFGGAFLLLGLTVLGMKAEEEKETLAAAGFTALAISMGVSMAGLFEITMVNSAESYEKFYYVTVSSNFLLFPSLLLVATYKRFKTWIRIFGLITLLPLLLSSAFFVGGFRGYQTLELISNTGYSMGMILYLLWAYNVYINYKKETAS